MQDCYVYRPTFNIPVHIVPHIFRQSIKPKFLVFAVELHHQLHHRRSSENFLGHMCTAKQSAYLKHMMY